MPSRSDAPVRNRTRVGNRRPPRAAAAAASPAASQRRVQRVIQLDGSSTVFPISEAVAEEFQKANPGIRVTVGISGTGGGFQKFCRGETDISDASRPISADRDRGLPEGRHRVHRAADRLRRPRDRRESEEHLGDDDHRRRAEDALGARGAGQGHELEPGPRRLARIARSTCSAPASTRAPTTTSPRRSSARKARAAATTRRARTTTCWCRASAATSSRSASCRFAYYEENKDKLKLVPVDDGKADNGDGPIAPSRRDGSQRHLSAAVAPALHLRRDEGGRPRPRSRSSSSSTSTQAGAGARSRLRRARRRRSTSWSREHFDGAKTGTVFGAARIAGRRDHRAAARARSARSSRRRVMRTRRLEWIIERALFLCAALSVLHDGRHHRRAGGRDGRVPARGADRRVPVRHRVDAAVRHTALRRAAAGRRHAAGLGHRDGGRAADGAAERDLPERVRAATACGASSSRCSRSWPACRRWSTATSRCCS